jgi:hypothetical protein
LQNEFAKDFYGIAETAEAMLRWVASPERLSAKIEAERLSASTINRASYESAPPIPPPQLSREFTPQFVSKQFSAPQMAPQEVEEKNQAASIITIVSKTSQVITIFSFVSKLGAWISTTPTATESYEKKIAAHSIHHSRSARIPTTAGCRF